jgi:hypothetical protein
MGTSTCSALQRQLQVFASVAHFPLLYWALAVSPLVSSLLTNLVAILPTAWRLM